ncbi:DUF1304 domain-containing protein [Allorhizobium undicola]|uniref:DUF1304 domain-containing protein n=1 Tax=Allorhizobium undicola TaxID=78527 RepID=UPI00047F0A55|nr:DUF1304 domain-containing protein [Allorhizobium undicola]
MVANLLVVLVALEHVYILVLEMFLWTRPVGRRAFRMSLERAQITRVMAANQGLYNGFLAAGLFWSVLHPDPVFAYQLKLFFLGAVVVAGLYGGKTVSRRILFIQAAPAAIALFSVLLTG